MIRYKNIIIFSVTFIIVALADIIIFFGLLSQILVDKFSWILNDTIFSLLLLFWTLICMPSLVAYFVAFVFLKKKKIEINNDEINPQQIEISEKLLRKKQFQTGLVATIILGVLITAFVQWGTKPRFLPYTIYDIQPGELVEPTPSIKNSSLTTDEKFLSPMPTGKIQTYISVSPTPEAVLSPTPKSRTPNPPIINISYPSEMQSITMNQSQTLCVVDVPTGGNTQGVQRKHQLNDGGWNSYVNLFTLCIEPKEGLNRLQIQYKNGDGEESTVYTRQFNFHRIAEISISLNGQLFRDMNCNGIRDSEEGGIGITATINIFKMPEFSMYNSINSDSNGSYSFSSKINESETITLQPIPVSPLGYKSNPQFTHPSIVFSSSNRSTTVDIPQVPNENVGACQ